MKLHQAVRETALYTLNGIQLKIGQIYFIPPYSWVDSNSGHLLHFVWKPNAAIIHISTDLNLNHQSWDRPCIYKSVRLIQAKRAVPVGFLWSSSKKSGSRWFCLNRAEPLWQTSLLRMHSLCLGLIHFSGLSPCFCGASESLLCSLGATTPMCEWWCRPPGVTGRGPLFKHSCALCRHQAFLGAQTGGKLGRRWRIATPERKKYVLFIQFLFFITAVATETADTKGLYSRLTPSSAHTHPPSPCHQEDNESKGRVFTDAPG